MMKCMIECTLISLQALNTRYNERRSVLDILLRVSMAGTALSGKLLSTPTGLAFNRTSQFLFVITNLGRTVPLSESRLGIAVYILLTALKLLPLIR